MTFSHTTDLLNDHCPFGQDSSSKHLSVQGRCPDLRDATAAGLQMTAALKGLISFLDGRPTGWSRGSLTSFEEWATDAHALHASAPATFSEIFPLNEGRNAEAILGRLTARPSGLSRAILKLHNRSKADLGNHRMAARTVMAAIGHRWDRIAVEDGVGELRLVDELTGLTERVHPEHVWRAPTAFGAETAIPISAESADTLNDYQTIQERADSDRAIRKTNLGVSRRMDVVEDLIGLQAAVTRDLQDWIDEDRKRLSLIRAFSEIALVGTDGRMIPNSRFLKILLHNWAEYFVGFDPMPIGELIRRCTNQSRLELVYEQNIAVLRKENQGRMFYGVAVRHCPAAAILGPLLTHYTRTH